MRVLVIGSGGREHALVWKIRQSTSVQEVYCAPGNPGIGGIARLIPIATGDLAGLRDFALAERIDLTVVGPEQPLAEGIVDLFEASGLTIFGPSKAAARLEWSKSFAKEFMTRHGIPTAPYKIFGADQFGAAEQFVLEADYPLVLKADGLAAGKGVLVCRNRDEGLAGVRDIMQKRVFGDAGNLLLVEEFLAGVEASLFVLSDGTDVVTLIPAQDYKRVRDGDEGKNTGGMGAYAPSARVDVKALTEIRRSIVEPAIRGMREDGCPYAGCLYVGLMMTKNGPSVVEFNSRFGDPETQVVLPLITGDFAEMLRSAATGELSHWHDQPIPDGMRHGAVCVILASDGYPGTYRKGMQIIGLDLLSQEEDVVAFHSGTGIADDHVVTAGGRVLGVTAFTTNGGVQQARKRAYEGVHQVTFEGVQFRRDIAGSLSGGYGS